MNSVPGLRGSERTFHSRVLRAVLNRNIQTGTVAMVAETSDTGPSENAASMSRCAMGMTPASIASAKIVIPGLRTVVKKFRNESWRQLRAMGMRAPNRCAQKAFWVVTSSSA